VPIARTTVGGVCLEPFGAKATPGLSGHSADRECSRNPLPHLKWHALGDRAKLCLGRHQRVSCGSAATGNRDAHSVRVVVPRAGPWGAQSSRKVPCSAAVKTASAMTVS